MKDNGSERPQDQRRPQTITRTKKLTNMDHKGTEMR